MGGLTCDKISLGIFACHMLGMADGRLLVVLYTRYKHNQWIDTLLSFPVCQDRSCDL